MTCPALQHLLDQHPRGAPREALEQHTLTCEACSAQWPEVHYLNRGLFHLHPPAPPSHLDAAITGALLSARRPQALSWGRRAALLAAASLLLAIGFAFWGIRPAPAPVTTARGPSIREVASRARAAGKRLIGKTVEKATQLLPPVGEAGGSEAPAPPASPLISTAEEVATGLTPVTDSAQRAVKVFFRDLPFGLKPS